MVRKTYESWKSIHLGVLLNAVLQMLHLSLPELYHKREGPELFTPFGEHLIRIWVHLQLLNVRMPRTFNTLFVRVYLSSCSTKVCPGSIAKMTQTYPYQYVLPGS